jgi:hypothetical protein
MVLPVDASSFRIASTTLSRMMLVLRQVGFWSVFDTTYFAGPLTMSPNGCRV